MKILSIETSCDETAISIVDFKKKSFEVLSDLVLSQIDIHKNYGGVYPALAKLEHISNLFPIFFQALSEAKIFQKRKKEKKLDKKTLNKIKKILNKDEHNFKILVDFFQNYKLTKKLDAISVTYGPGLEIALWTGFNFAKAVATILNIKLIPVNHMEGHILASFIEKTENNKKFEIKNPTYPALALLISGGHTELQLIKKELSYKMIGSTLDDAVGEAYDKTARLIGISYPGGPEISRLAEKWNKTKIQKTKIKLPRPMLTKPNFNFSFSGLKTAVLYLVKSKKRITQKFKEELSAEFENAVSEVLIKKTKKAIEKFDVKTLIIGGGVSANFRLRKDFQELTKEKNINLLLPDKKYTGDNALMIALAGYFRIKNNKCPKRISKVNGNLKLK